MDTFIVFCWIFMLSLANFCSQEKLLRYEIIQWCSKDRILFIIMLLGQTSNPNNMKNSFLLLGRNFRPETSLRSHKSEFSGHACLSPCPSPKACPRFLFNYSFLSESVSEPVSASMSVFVTEPSKNLGQTRTWGHIKTLVRVRRTLTCIYWFETVYWGCFTLNNFVNKYES